MKKILFTLAVMLATTLSASAMSYEQAREQALFLTDKMAYELNLTEEQYEAAYEVNLDYLMSVNTVDDVFSDYWTRRNLDLSYILMDWQYRTFCESLYFYRPIYWDAGLWHFRIYAYYPVREYFYFGRPGFYFSYRGGHCWRVNGGRSWYRGRTYHHVVGHAMRDGWNRGGYRNVSHGWRPGDGGHSHRSGVQRSDRSSGYSGRTGAEHRSSGYTGRTSGEQRSSGYSGRTGGEQRSSGYSGRTGGEQRSSGYSGRTHSEASGRPSSTRETVGSGNRNYGGTRQSGSSGYTPSHSFSGGGFHGGGHSGGGHFSGGHSGGGHGGGGRR